MGIKDIRHKAAIDADFRTRLVADPKAVLAAEGVDTPATAEVCIVEDNDDTSDSRTGSRPTDGTALTLTCGMPSRSDSGDFAIPRIPCRTGTSVHHTPNPTHLT